MQKLCRRMQDSLVTKMLVTVAFALTDGTSTPSTKAQASCSWASLPPPVPLKCGVIWFVHISKTGGTTIGREWESGALQHSTLGWRFERVRSMPAMNRVFRQLATEQRPRLLVEHHGWGTSKTLSMSGWPVCPFENNAMVAMDQLLGPLRCQLEANGCKLLLVTLLRDPYSRAVSSFFFERSWRTRLNMTGQSIGGQRVSIDSDEFLRWQVARDGNAQTLYLLYNSIPHRPPRLDPADALNASLKLLLHFDIVGRTEALEPFMQYIYARIGWPTWEQVHHDVTPESVKFELSNEQRAYIRDHVRVDMALYGHFCRGPNNTAVMKRHSPPVNCLRNQRVHSNLLPAPPMGNPALLKVPSDFWELLNVTGACAREPATTHA